MFLIVSYFWIRVFEFYFSFFIENIWLETQNKTLLSSFFGKCFRRSLYWKGTWFS